MKGRFFKTFSLILSIILLINMLPLNVWAEEMDTVAKVETQTKAEPAQAEVLGEVIEKRTQYTKDYRLSNGFYVSAVYAEPVHFEEDGQWEEIDNTLKARSDGTYGNTAGVWDVRFPQLLTKDRNVTITKDGYTLSFGMAGELRNQGNLEIASVGDSAEPAAIGAADMDATVVPTPLETANVDLGDKTETFAVSTAQITSAQILNTDDRAAREAAQYEELVLTKTSSGLMYNNVYGSTDIQYDLQSNKVKESVILESYDADLRGFRYNLDVGELVPVLNDDGSIDFYDAEEENIVMVMPAPFLIDDAMVTSHDVRVVLNGTGSSYTLIYMLPHSWLAEEGRSWPVILDPVVQADPNALTNIQDRTVAKNGSYLIDDVYLYSGYKQDTQINHSYIVFTNLPARSSSDVIVSANLTLQRYGGTSNGAIPIEAHKVNSTWTSSGLTWSTDRFNAKVEDYQLVDANGYYTWNITDLVRDWYSGNNTGVMLKASTTIESSGTDNYSRFYSSDTGYASRMPTLTVLYRNNNGLESYWNYTSASAGRAGTGHVNSYTGNLTWVRDIMSFGGNRMPVSISHVYNLNDRNNNTFGMGNGWRTNFNQRAYTWEQDYNYYIWEDADGTAHYFRASDTHIYKDEDGLELTLRTNVPGEYPVTITDKKGNVSYFDSKGRLAKLENYQQTRSSITITYTTSSGPLIQEIKDGVNRSYKFSYNTSNNSNQLTRIDYYGTDTVIDYTTQFQYTGNNLTGITDNDGKTSIYSYASNSVLSSASDIDGYKLSYEYYEPTSTSTWKPYRVKKVAESHGSDSGGTLTLEYAHNQTTFTDHNQNVEIMQFNDYGNAISIQDGLGRAQYMQFAINNSEEKAEVDAAPQGSDEKNKKPNQLILASRMQNTVSNLLTNTSFESSNIWTSNDTAGVSVSHVGGNSYMGSYSMRLSSTASASTYTGAYSPTFTVASGESVTFSAYVNSTVNGARLGLNYYHNGEYVNHTSAPVATSSWVRAEVSFTNDTNQSLSVAAYVFVPGSGTTYVDCVQVEKMPAASRYNMVQNGDFRSGVNGWSGSAGSITDISIFKNPQNPQESQKSAAPQLSNDVYKMTGSITEERRVSQEIDISGSKDDTFVLAGWAKGNSVPLPKAEDGENQRQFAIIGQFYNETEAVGEEVIAQFNPDTNSSDAWQYAAQPMIADGTFTKIRITLAYDYNANDVFFDGIQLFKEEFGSKYTYNAAGDVSYIENEEGQTIKLKYDSGTNVIAEGEIVEILPNGNETYKPGTQTTYTYDGYHNVLTATSADGRVEEYTYDEWGNIKTASVSGGGMTSTTAYEYANSGNTLAKVTDAVGNETNYVYNAQTSLLTSVRYPNDTDSTKTEYVYNDPMYRTTEVHSTTNTGKAMSANYTYNNDLLASIATPSSTYSFTYGNFGLRESVTVGTKTLAEYTYTATNHYLQSLAYGNNDVVQYTYDKYGRVTEQRHYENGNTTTVDSRVTYQYDNDGALASVFDSATGLTTKYYYDFTGRNGATELRNGADLVFRVSATYDEHNQITSQTRQYASGSYTDTYTYNDNHTLQGMVLGNIRGIGYDYDGIQRIVAMNTGDKTNTDDPNAFAPNGREFTYRDGTNQIARVRYDELMAKRQYPSFDFDYTYDDNGNIATYTSPVESITYTYDSQNQLTSARNTGNGMVFSYEYDAAGNILTATKGGTTYSYTYGNSDWGDLLTAYNGASITYDAIGNPLSYYNGWSFTWQQGREMATATKGSQSLSFTYDADGIRKTKTVNGVVHTYYYSGGKLARETYGSNILDFFYDQNGHPFMLVYNGTVYYYITNAQGDVIRLTDVKGQTAARYQYDPYGNIIDSAGSHVDINPLRYRGYYYDSESGLYYLQSRYYDPNIGRFINADGLITTGHDMLGNNLFAYCNDNPVNLIDPGGNKPGDLFDTMDEAAQNAAYYIGSLSFINGWEYGTNIYTVDVAVNVEVEVIEYVFGENTKITKSTVTVQRTVTKYTYSCEVTSRDPRSVTIPVPPAEINRVAIFHTHPYGSNQGITQLSGKDIAIAQHRGIPMYVYGPNGQMHVYYPQTNITVIWDLFPISTKQPWLQTPSWLL